MFRCTWRKLYRFSRRNSYTRVVIRAGSCSMQSMCLLSFWTNVVSGHILYATLRKLETGMKILLLGILICTFQYYHKKKKKFGNLAASFQLLLRKFEIYSELCYRFHDWYQGRNYLDLFRSKSSNPSKLRFRPHLSRSNFI